ncbi:MAG: hypothetical protein MJ180_01900 [Candidatus Gastranaerophilales bacterium]|nr:hypothetical protein [Candidatus Gastranaerophilales bacterium]
MATVPSIKEDPAAWFENYAYTQTVGKMRTNANGELFNTADANHDGIVDGNDFKELQERWEARAKAKAAAAEETKDPEPTVESGGGSSGGDSTDTPEETPYGNYLLQAQYVCWAYSEMKGKKRKNLDATKQKLFDVADVNKDGEVNKDDLAQIKRDYAAYGVSISTNDTSKPKLEDLPLDFDKDGDVDGDDLAFATNYKGKLGKYSSDSNAPMKTEWIDKLIAAINKVIKKNK